MTRIKQLVALAIVVAGCTTGSTTDATRTAADITIVSGGDQTGFTGVTLSQPIVVKVTAADGTALAGQTVDFSVASGQATLTPTSAVTGATGTAQTQVTIGSSAANVVVVATVRATTIQASVSVAVQQNTSNLTCTSSNTISLGIGEARTSLSGSGICLQATTASTYLIHAFYSSTVASANTLVGITGFGIGPSSSASLNSTPASSVSSFDIGSIGPSDYPSRALDLRMRQLERTQLAPRMRSARAAYRRRGASLLTTTPTVGTLVRYDASEGCNDTPVFRTGRVAAVTNKAIVVADTGNPAGGFTDAEYQSIGVTFDTLVDPLDEGAFGAPSDIDGNGRIILFYTRAVNELTPAKSQGIIEGFFNPRDLFPTTGASPDDHCSESNFAEMFYLIVPDPNGTINGNVRSKADVQQFTISVSAHEFQHLINAARRMYVNNADDFEEVWLNEGLSHVAEELLFYRVSGMTPRLNIDATAIRASSQRVNAFNNYAVANFGRYETFLQSPSQNSPYADNDSLETRGATWSVLRYLADRKASTDGTIWSQLVNSTTEGIANLQNVFGTDLLNQMRDWSISAFTDDNASTTSAFQQPSWNFRSIFPALQINPFPLKTVALSNGVQTSQALVGGGSLYTTAGVAAGGTASISWSVGSPSVLISVVRV
ncbi:MAG TPA: Ig-like domain-containing protein, partial [Gemmatimonadaceae bacterium]